MAEHLPPGAGLGGAGALSAAHVEGQRGLRVLSAGGVLLSVCDLGGGASLLKASLLLTQSLSTFLPIQVISPAARTLPCSLARPPAPPTGLPRLFLAVLLPPGTAPLSPWLA